MLQYSASLQGRFVKRLSILRQAYNEDIPYVFLREVQMPQEALHEIVL